jgi:hypothetical protein
MNDTAHCLLLLLLYCYTDTRGTKHGARVSIHVEYVTIRVGVLAAMVRREWWDAILTRQGGGRVICMLESLAAAKSQMRALQHIIIASIIFRAFRVPINEIFFYVSTINPSEPAKGYGSSKRCRVM